MGTQLYSTTQRIGKLKGEILAHAIPVEVLGLTGSQKQMPKNTGNNVVFRRWLPYGGTDNKWITGSNVSTWLANQQTSEGVTPTADTLTPTDITVTLVQYSALYAVTDVMHDLHEDGAEIPDEMKVQTGQRIGLIREMVRYGALKAATNAFFAGGTTRGTVAATLSVNLLRKVAKDILAKHAKQITSVLAPSANFATAPVEAGFLVFCHTDMEPAVRNLPGFKHVSEYGQRKPVNENEIGSVERFRFVLSPELAPYIDSGAAVGSTGLYSTTGTSIDVYPVIVAGENAWGQVALRGSSSLEVTWLPPGTKDKSDPLGQRGYIGAKTYAAASVLNQGWMALIEAGTPDLT